MEGRPPALATAEEIRKTVTDGQVRLSERCAEIWDAPRVFTGRRLLDIGCGLGGPAIHWAELYGAQVTAVTIVPEHARRRLPVRRGRSPRPGGRQTAARRLREDRHRFAAEYQKAAAEQGFVKDRDEDLTEETANAWQWSMASAKETELRLLRSIREHAWMWRCFYDHAYEVRALRFQKVP